MSDVEQVREDLLRKIMVLNDRVWEDKLPLPLVNRWLDNFTGRVVAAEIEKLHALFWLSNFMYFGAREMRVLLRSLYRDLYLLPLIQQVRESKSPSDDAHLCALVADEMRNTRFLGVGNPSESGVHLLYYFRQENDLSKDLFVDGARVLGRDTSGGRGLREPHVTRYVFVDDVCGSGDTVITYSAFVDEIKAASPDVEISYLCLFATVAGLQNVQVNSSFGSNSRAVYELDDSYRCLDAQSRYFGPAVPAFIDRDIACNLVREYGNLLNPAVATGWGDSQLLVGFHHNTPDNVPAFIWYDSAWGAGLSWHPAFKRYPKF